MVRTFSRFAVCALVLVGATACGASDPSDDVAEGGDQALSERRESLSRTLAPQLPISEVAAIGQKPSAVLERETAHHRSHSQWTAEDGCKIENFRRLDAPPDDGDMRAAFKKGDVQSRKCGRSESIAVFLEDGVLASTRNYTDRSGDGLIDTFTEPYRSVRDSDEDGKVDVIEEWGAALTDARISGYPGWTPPSKPWRLLEDTDRDGRFDRETIRAGSDSTWWTKAP